MERVGTLINKLKEQFDQQADAEKLAITAQLILAELQFKNIGQTVQGNVSVLLPISSAKASAELPIQAVFEEKSNHLPGWNTEMPAEIPTLSLQAYPANPTKKELKLDIAKELTPLNELFPLNPITEINDQLKEERVEVAAKLDETPIRDLRKAISVNDKYLFAHVLFRGDESMYERSIKTINNFSIYPEAQYWIQRELKVKLGWEDSNETVKLFDQLVKRRFS
jgi:hypothetical protein